jgi:hypothetical protein
MKTLQDFSKRFCPPILMDSLYYIKAIQRYFIYKGQLKRNMDLCNKYMGEKVYILANGPSLNNFDLSVINENAVITMNHFELHPMKDSLNIVAHCIGEPFSSSTWENPMPMVNGIKSNTYWFNADAAKYFMQIERGDIRYYLPGLTANAAILQGNDLTGVALRYQSTSQMAINIALYMGFKEIYLVGFDHDWLVTRGNSPHFYQERDDVDKADLSKYSYIEMIKISLNLFSIYVKLNQIAKSKNAKIWNLTEPSYLDVFPRVTNSDNGLNY